MEIIAIIISVITLGALIFVILKVQGLGASGQDHQSFGLMQQQIEGFRNQITTQIGQFNEQISKLYSDNQTILQKVNTDFTQTLQTVDKNVNSRLDNAAKVINDVNRKLGEVYETTKQVQEVGKDIASLSEILRAPKLRGGMGELFLGDLLNQVLPPATFELQYRFKSREIVDAVIKLGKNLVPVDSKFPLENFRKYIEAESETEKIRLKKEFIRDVKKHIDAIAGKYILQDEGTFGFALMYIPAENVYYETIIKDENLDEGKGIFTYAIEKKVLPVSPNSFYAYLQTILLGLRGMQVEEKAEEILKNLSRLGGDFGKVSEDFEKMGTHLKNLNASYENTEKRLDKFGNKLETLEVKQEPTLLA
ncbi:MAG: DNA recombination protein RmuC [Candidatus Saganbacteria bacterium]|nr:DNA recombination protein RmuC [Candidatus Saganbacteria bacterium]